MKIGLKQKRNKLDRWAGAELYALLLPSLAYVLIFYYGPMYGVQIAFKDFRPNLGIWGSQWVGFKHFIRFFQFPQLLQMIRNTLSITLYGLATFPLAIILALMLNELTNLKFKKTVQMISYAPYFLSTVVICGLILLFLDRAYGVVNTVIIALGGERVAFMANPSYFASIFVWSGVWQGLGWGTILYIAALSGVSPELIDAARIDGATKLQIIRHVNLPCIMPTIIIVFIMSMGGLLSVGFEKIFLLQNPLNMSASQVLATYIYNVGIQGGQFSYSSAIGFFQTIVNLTMICTANFIIKRLTESGGLF